MLKLFATNCLLILALIPATSIADIGAEIELHPVSSGTYTIAIEFAPTLEAEFLLDTGASMVMMSDKLFKAIAKQQKTVPTGKVAANMASGRIKTIPTYEIPSLILANGCDVGPLEVAVIRGASRNLIGINALEKLGRITLDLQATKLIAADCPTTHLSDHKVVSL
ncbi:MAG: putative aspartyl protease [Methylophagaceae bacterium]|jgi:predicted aspartyl protease